MSIKSIAINYCPSFLSSVFARIKTSPVGYRFAKGMFWSLAGSLTARGLGLVSSVIVARILGKTGFGELGIIQSTVGMFGTFAGFGLGMTATKFIAEYRSTDPARAGRIRGLSSAFAWITSAVTSIILFFMAPWLAEHTLAAPHLAGLLRISTILLFLTSINGAQTGALSGFEAFRTIARVNIWSGLATFPLMVGGVYIAGLTGAVWGLLLATGLNWLLNHLAIRKECSHVGVPYTYDACWKEREILWRFSLPSVLGGVLIGPVMWAASALLVNQPNGYSEMGVYNAVLRIKQVPELILGMIMAPLLPILSEQFGNKSTDQYNKTLKYAFVLSLLVLVPISLVQIAVPDITLLPYGAEFHGHKKVVQWLMIHSILVGIFYPFGTILASMSKMWFGWVYNLFWSALYISSAYLLISSKGAEGLSIAFSCAHLVSCIFMTIYIYRKEPAFLSQLPFMRFVSLTTAAVMVCMLLQYCQSPYMAGLISSAIVIIYIMLLKGCLKDLRKREDYSVC